MKHTAATAAALALLAVVGCSQGQGTGAEGGSLRGRDEAAAGCPADRAVYALRASPGPELRFVRFARPEVSNLALHLRVDDKDYWYWLSESQGYGSISATLGPNPTDDIEDPPQFEAEAIDNGPFTAFSATFDVIPRAPRIGDPSPAHVFAPDMGVSIWFATSDTEARTVLPGAMWDFDRCAPAEDEAAP